MFGNFASNNFDNQIILSHGEVKYSLIDVKKMVVKKFNAMPNQKQIIITGEDNLDFVITFLAAVFSKKEIYLTDNNTNCDIEISTDNQPLDFEDFEPEKIYVNFFTSGSGGKSKLVKKNLYNLIREAEDIGKIFLTSEKDLRFCSTTTMNHLFGCTFHFMTPFINGFVIDTTRISYPENVKYDNCFLVSSPSFLDKISKYELNFQTTPKYIIVAGAKLHNETFEYFEKSSKVIEIYGSTETGVIAHRESSQDDFLTLFDNVKVLDYKDCILTIKSDYFQEDKAALADYTNYIEPNKLCVVSRSDRILKIYDKRISAEQIEKFLKSTDLVEDAYCFKLNEKLAAAIVLNNKGKDLYITNGQSALAKHLKTLCLNNFEIVPQKWRFLPEIYKTCAGKVDKDKITEIFLTNISFPLVLEQRLLDNTAEIDLIFPKNANFFKGHFPNFPVLPGVVSLYFVTFFSNIYFETLTAPQIFRKIKFSKLIYPNQKVTIKLVNAEKNVAFEMISKEEVCVSGILSKEHLYD